MFETSKDSKRLVPVNCVLNNLFEHNRNKVLDRLERNKQEFSEDGVDNLIKKISLKRCEKNLITQYLMKS